MISIDQLIYSDLNSDSDFIWSILNIILILVLNWSNFDFDIDFIWTILILILISFDQFWFWWGIQLWFSYWFHLTNFDFDFDIDFIWWILILMGIQLWFWIWFWYWFHLINWFSYWFHLAAWVYTASISDLVCVSFSVASAAVCATTSMMSNSFLMFLMVTVVF